MVALLVLPLQFGCLSSNESDPSRGNFIQGSLYGEVSADGLPLDGVQLAVVDQAGQSVVDEVTLVDPSGAFSVLVTAPEGSGLRVDATLRNGIVLHADLEKYVPDAFIPVNFLSSLVHAYRQVHPEVAIDTARTRVFDFLGIPAVWRQGDEPVNSELSLVSEEAFLTLAMTDKEGLDHFLKTQVVSYIDTGKTVSVRDDNNQAWEALDAELNNRVIASRTPGVKLSKEVEQTFSGRVPAGDTYIVGTISVLSNIAGVVMKGMSLARDREAAAAVDAYLASMESKLSNIQAQISTLSKWIATRFDQAEYRILSSQVNPYLIEISNAYAKVAKATRYAVARNLTDLDTTTQALQQETLDSLYKAAQNIHQTQWGKDSLSAGMISKARSLVGASSLTSAQTQSEFEQQIQSYAGNQAQAVSVIASLGQPGIRYKSTDLYDVAYTFLSNDAGTRNLAAQYIDQVVDHIQLQRSFAAKPLPDTSHVHDIANNVVYHREAQTAGSGASKYQYAQSYKAGGLGKWAIANRASLASLISRNGGIDGLNRNFGFNLQPGRVEFLQQRMHCNCYNMSCNRDCRWVSDGMQKATDRGFLTIDLRADGRAEYGWVDDRGNSGRIGDSGANDIVSAMNSDRSVYIKEGPRSAYSTDTYWCGKINGPAVLMTRVTSASVQTSGTAVALGMYASLAVARDVGRAFTPDVLSGGSSGTEGLTALPVAMSGGPSTTGQDLTTEVFWEALDPLTGVAADLDVVTISNLRAPKTPSSPEFAVPRSGPGMVHWLPGSFGAQVTFRASRYLPNGSRVTGEVTLASPVVRAQAAPDALDVFPPYLQTSSQRLADKGVQLYATRHWPRGWFENVTSGVVYASSHPGVTVSPSGLVLRVSGATIAPGTTVTITATDALIKAQPGIATRPSDTSQILID